MAVIRLHTLLGMLGFLLLAACAASPPSEPVVGAKAPSADRAPAVAAASPTVNEGKAAREERVDVRLAGATSLLGSSSSGDESFFASNLSLSLDRLLSYQASWSVEPGDVLAMEDAGAAGASAPTRFAGQRMGQNLEVTLPELAGAPLSLAVSSEFQNNWMVSGATQLQRERASLSWSPGPASVDVQWAGAASLFDNSVALSCDLESTIRLPTHERQGHSEAVRISGKECVVAADGASYAGIAAQTWGLSYVWSRPGRQSEAVLSVIDPEWTRVLDFQDVGPGYELGIRHRRNFGFLTAQALVSLRQAPAIVPADLVEDDLGADTDWAANASLTWQLADASVSAKWAKGVDRLWFTPDQGQRGDHFGLALNFSRWIETLFPQSSPQLAMNWNWSEVHLQDAGVTGSNSLRLDVALMF